MIAGIKREVSAEVRKKLFAEFEEALMKRFNEVPKPPMLERMGIKSLSLHK